MRLTTEILISLEWNKTPSSDKSVIAESEESGYSPYPSSVYYYDQNGNLQEMSHSMFRRLQQNENGFLNFSPNKNLIQINGKTILLNPSSFPQNFHSNIRVSYSRINCYSEFI